MSSTARLIAAIEGLVVEGVGITALSLAEAGPGVELSLIQWRALVIIGSSTDGVRVGEIARLSGSAAPAVSRLLRRLERRGFITSERDESDRRATIVRLTDLGETVRSDIVRLRQRIIASALAHHPVVPSTDVVDALLDITVALVEAADRGPDGPPASARRDHGLDDR